MLNGYWKRITIDSKSYWIALTDITSNTLDFMICDQAKDKIVWALSSIPRGDWDLTTTTGLEKAAMEIFDFWYSSVNKNGKVHQEEILNNRKDK